jgi:hypothetical protein
MTKQEFIKINNGKKFIRTIINFETIEEQKAFFIKEAEKEGYAYVSSNDRKVYFTKNGDDLVCRYDMREQNLEGTIKFRSRDYMFCHDNEKVYGDIKDIFILDDKSFVAYDLVYTLI